jgi:hypothetical protein
MTVVLPLFAETNDALLYVGNGFLIAEWIFVRGRHVAEEITELVESGHGSARAAALLITPAGGGPIPVMSFRYSPPDPVTSDLATGTLEPIVIDGKSMSLPVLKLSVDPVIEGEGVVALGYAGLCPHLGANEH